MRYAHEHNARMPEAEMWPNAVAIQIKYDTDLTCPASGRRYIFNKALSGASIEDIPDSGDVPLVWDAPLDEKGTSGPHDGTFFACYLDGHTDSVHASLP